MDLAKVLDPNEAFDATASADDIYHCFRLLLGRNPSAAEWPGHSALAGNELRSVVRSYLDSREFANRGLIAREAAADIALTQADGFAVYTAADDLAVGAHVAAGAYEPHVAALLRSRLRPGMAVADLGANIGYFTMLSASLVGPAGFVLAVEPNLRNVRMIEASRRANGFDQVTIAACAAGANLGILALNTAFSNGVTSPVGGALAEVMAAPIVPCLPLSALWPAWRRVDLIKIDVEGAEHTTLAAARDMIAQWRPVIASEFSPSLLEANSGVSGRAYLEFLAGFGYRMSVVGDPERTHGTSVDDVLAAYERSGGDHIDVVFLP